MTQEPQDSNSIQRQLIKYQLFSTPAVIMIGLALYGLFGAQDGAFPSILNHEDVAYSLLTAGIALEAWVMLKTIPLIRHRKRPSNPE